MQVTSQGTPSTGARCEMVTRVCASAPAPFRSIELPPRRWVTVTPFAYPAWQVAMNASPVPSVQVATMRPSGCQSDRRRSQSPGVAPDDPVLQQVADLAAVRDGVMVRHWGCGGRACGHVAFPIWAWTRGTGRLRHLPVASPHVLDPGLVGEAGPMAGRQCVQRRRRQVHPVGIDP